LNLILSRITLTLKTWKVIYHQVLIKFRQNWSKQEVVRYVLWSTNLLILTGIWKICHSSGRNLLLYLLKRKVIKVTILIIKGYWCYQVQTKFYPVFFSQDWLHYRGEIIGDH